MRAGVLAASLALAGASGFVAEAPTLNVSRDGLAVGRLPPILAEPAVAKHLGTGLTTTLLLTVESLGGPSLRGVAQIGVRFDLWDELYIVETLDANGTAKATLASRDELQRWWQSLVLSVSPEARPATQSRKARLTLQVLPFSQAEQQDAQEWLLRSFRASEPSPATPARPDAPAPPQTPVRDFYGAMLASSIGRRSLITYSWTVPIGDSR